jgi:DNA-binding LacI/PurR family transcriptional regulator
MGIIKEAEGDATEIVVYDQESAASVTSPLLSSLPVTRRLDGLLIMGLPVDDVLAERLLAQNLPTVLIDSTRPEVDLVVRATT